MATGGSGGASSGAVRAGRAFLEIFVNDNAVYRSLDKLRAHLQGAGAFIGKMGAATGAAGAAILAPLVGMAKVFADAGSELKDMSDRTGIAVEKLHDLEFAAGMSGASLQDVEASVRAMQKALAKGGEEAEGAKGAWGELGLSLSDLRDMNPEEQFIALADAISKIEDPSKRAALAMQVWGKSGTQLLPMLTDGKAGLDALFAQNRQTRGIFTAADAEAASALGDSIDLLEMQIKAVLATIGSAIAGPLTEFAAAITPIVKGIMDWANRNQEIVATVALVAGGMVGLGTAAAAVGGAMVALGPVLGMVGSALGALVSWPGLIAAGLGALFIAGGAAAGWADGLGSAFDIIMSRYQEVLNIFSGGDVVGGFAAAWSMLSDAADAALAPVRETIGQVTEWILGKWNDLTSMLGKLWQDWGDVILVALAPIAAAVLIPIAAAALQIYQAWKLLNSELAAESLKAYVAQLQATYDIALAIGQTWASMLGTAPMMREAFGAVFGYLGDSLSGFGDLIGDIFGDFKTAFGGIVAAVQKGDFQGAFEIVMTSLELAWAKTVKFLTEEWGKFKGVFVDGWDKLASAAIVAFKSIGPELVEFFLGTWEKVRIAFFDILRGIVTAAQDVLRRLPRGNKLAAELDPIKGLLDTAQISGTEEIQKKIGAAKDEKAGIAADEAAKLEKKLAPRKEARDKDVADAQSKVDEVQAKIDKLVASANAAEPPAPEQPAAPVDPLAATIARLEAQLGTAGMVMTDAMMNRAKDIEDAASAAYTMSRGTFNAASASQQFAFGNRSKEQDAKAMAKNVAAMLGSIVRQEDKFDQLIDVCGEFSAFSG